MRRHRTALTEQLTEGPTVDEFHNEENMPRRVRALVVDVDERLVIEVRDRAGLTFEADAERLVVDKTRIHDLCGHPAIEPQIGGAVHGAHATVCDGGSDTVATIENLPLDKLRHKPAFPVPINCF